MNYIRERRAYSMTFWTMFFGLVLIPILALAIEVGRYYYARGEVAKAADAAALAAAAEINQLVFEQSGNLQPTSQTWANAQSFANLNDNYLAQYGIYASVTGISINTGSHTVQVSVSANLAKLFPSVIPVVWVSGVGKAQISEFTK